MVLQWVSRIEVNSAAVKVPEVTQLGNCSCQTQLCPKCHMSETVSRVRNHVALLEGESVLLGLRGVLPVAQPYPSVDQHDYPMVVTLTHFMLFATVICLNIWSSRIATYGASVSAGLIRHRAKVELPGGLRNGIQPGDVRGGSGNARAVRRARWGGGGSSDEPSDDREQRGDLHSS